MIGDNLLKSNRELQSPHSLFGVMASGISGHLGADEYTSMYESRSALTTIQKQHFVEWFSGNALDSIWTFNGTNNGGMADSADGGYRVLPSSGANVIMYFNNKRQYAYNGSVCIAVATGVSDTRMDMLVGFSADSEFSGGTTDKSVYKSDNGGGSLKMNTSDGSTETATSTTRGSPIASSFHNGTFITVKIENNASSTQFSINGVVDGTITTTLPNADMQPAMEVRSISGDGDDYGAIRYLEAYNT